MCGLGLERSGLGLEGDGLGVSLGLECRGRALGVESSLLNNRIRTFDICYTVHYTMQTLFAVCRVPNEYSVLHVFLTYYLCYTYIHLGVIGLGLDLGLLVLSPTKITAVVGLPRPSCQHHRQETD